MQGAMSKYNVNFKRLALLLLPTFLRRPLVASMLFVFTSHLRAIYVGLTRFRESTTYRLCHNGQVCHLRAVLNDEFDPAARRIEIADNPHSNTGVVVYQREVGLPITIYNREGQRPLIVNRRGYGGVSSYDFVVMIPEFLRSGIDIAHLRALVDKYKLASKRFTINYI